MEDLQSLLEKINRDGVEKAQAEATRILDAAKAEAAALRKSAREEADRIKAEGEKAAADYAARAAETVGQGARDTVLKIQTAVTTLLEKLLAQGVDRALGNDETVAELVTEAVKGLVGPGEIACGPKLAAALKARLASLGAFKVVLDETMDTGFSVKTDGGRVEHAFTGETIAAELAKRLRPDLAKLVKG